MRNHKGIMPFSCYSLGTGKVFFICDLDCSMIIILNPFITISDLDIISPYNINSLSSRQFVKRRKKNINYGNIYWSNNSSSELILEEIYGRQYKKNCLQDLGSERDIWLYIKVTFSSSNWEKPAKKAIILSGIIGQSIHMYFYSTLSRHVSFWALKFSAVENPP